jgi:hypothetical protein
MTYAMMPYNGSMRPNPARNNGSDLEGTPVSWRMKQNPNGALDVQLLNGVGQISMKRMSSVNPHATGRLYAASQIIPPHQWRDYGGWHIRGPAPANVQNLWEAGPGAQPANPGGPGKIASPAFINPMTS